MIEVRGLTRRYGGTLALDDVTFVVAEGEIVGFLGPNGAGKSTTMKILTCSVAPTAGTASVAGCDVLDDPLGVRRRIGFMPEHTALYTDQSVRSLLEFVAAVKEFPAAGRRAHLDGIVERTGLADVRGKLVGALSHGYRKRVGLAQALVGDPQVLILDEPTSGLDPHQTVEIRELIKGLRGRRTVLFSSHILSEVSATCERVLILDKGRLVGQQGTAGMSPQTLAELAETQPRVVLTWDGNRDEVVAALTRVAGVDEILVNDAGAEVIIAGNPVEIRPRLVESVVNAGGRLQNIQDKSPSLEDLFLRLTGGDVRREPDPAVPADGGPEVP